MEQTGFAEFVVAYQCQSFIQQGMEKFNDASSKTFFRSTGHRGNDTLKQILPKTEGSVS